MRSISRKESRYIKTFFRWKIQDKRYIPNKRSTKYDGSSEGGREGERLSSQTNRISYKVRLCERICRCGVRAHPSSGPASEDAARNIPSVFRPVYLQENISLAHPDGGGGVDGEVYHLPTTRRSCQGAARPHHDTAADVVEQAGISSIIQKLRHHRPQWLPQYKRLSINV